MTAFKETGPSQAQDPEGHEVEGHRIGSVQEEARQMIAEGLHTPEQVVQAERHPGQRNPVTHVNRGPHPAELGPAESTIVRVIDEIDVAECGSQRRSEFMRHLADQVIFEAFGFGNWRNVAEHDDAALQDAFR